MRMPIVPPGCAPATGAAGPTASFTRAAVCCRMESVEAVRTAPVFSLQPMNVVVRSRPTSAARAREKEEWSTVTPPAREKEGGSSSRLRVERVAQRIAEQVERQHEHEDRDARERRERGI